MPESIPLWARATIATLAFLAVVVAGFWLSFFWATGTLVVVATAIANAGRSSEPDPMLEAARAVAPAGWALSAAIIIVFTFVVAAIAKRLVKFRSPASAAISASCVASVTIAVAVAMVVLLRYLPAIDGVVTVSLWAIVVWCAALAGTVPKASRAWLAVLGVVSVSTVYTAYVFATGIRL